MPPSHSHYCYKCLATEADNVRLRGNASSCICGCWSNFCSPISTNADIASFIRYTDGIPFDTRCGCAICPDCKKDRPCGLCSGSCSVCKGFLNPGPSGVIRKGDRAWLPVRPLDLQTQGHPSRIFHACEVGDTTSLFNICQEVFDGDRIWVTDLDKANGFKNIYDEDEEDNEDEDEDDEESNRDDEEEGEGLFAGSEALSELVGQWRNKNKASLLDHAITSLRSSPGHLDFFRTLLQLPGHNPNRLNRFRDTPLTSAVLNAWDQPHVLDSVRALLEHPKVRVNKANGYGLTPLMVCIRTASGSCAVLDLLLANRQVRLNCECIINDNDEPDDNDEPGLEGSSPLALALARAVEEGLLQQPLPREWPVLERLLAHRRVMVNWQNNMRETALLHFLRLAPQFYSREDAELIIPPVINRLLQVPGVLSNLPDCLGMTPVGLAIEHGYLDVFQQLVSIPLTDLRFRARNGRNYLMMAVTFNRLEIFSALLNSRLIDVNAVDKDGCTALALASNKTGNEAILRALLAAPGVNKNAPNTKGQTPFFLALLYRNLTAVSILLTDLGVEINDADSNGTTPLSLVASNGNEGLVASILSSGRIVNLDSRDLQGLTCLDSAVRGGHLGVVRLLLLYQVNLPEGLISNRPKDGITCLQAACQLKPDGPGPDIVKEILAAPSVDVNIAFHTKDGDSTALLFAAAKGATKLLKSLLRKRPIAIDVNKTSPLDGISALMLTASLGFVKCTEALVAHPSINMNQQDRGGRTALWWVLDFKVTTSDDYSLRESVVKILLSHPRIDINQADRRGCTPLAVALRLDKVSVMGLRSHSNQAHADVDNLGLFRLLVDRPEADVNVLDLAGYSLIDLALSKQCRVLLRERGCTHGSFFLRMCDQLC